MTVIDEDKRSEETRTHMPCYVSSFVSYRNGTVLCNTK